ncbi:MAG: hypothetical protein ACXQS8_03755 [Candidatus Helarchaeales archaeon]
MHLINELWIITESGLTIYNQKVDDVVDADLFGGFISALNQFAKQLGEDEFKTIEMGDCRLIVKRCEECKVLFVTRSDKKVKLKSVEEYLECIKENFYEKFKDKLENWNGDLDEFKDISKVLNIKDDPKNFFGFALSSSTSKNILNKL